jgi:hypothetical protein
VPCAAEEPPKSYEEEVAERAALTAFLRSEPISVTGLVHGSDNSSGDAETFVGVCQSWKMTETDVVEFFKTGHAMPGEECHHGYDVYPCAFRGFLQVSNRVFEFRLNLGSFAHLRDTAAASDGHWIGCPEPCRHLFPRQVRWTDPTDL